MLPRSVSAVDNAGGSVTTSTGSGVFVSCTCISVVIWFASTVSGVFGCITVALFAPISVGVIVDWQLRVQIRRVPHHCYWMYVVKGVRSHCSL